MNLIVLVYLILNILIINYHNDGSDTLNGPILLDKSFDLGSNIPGRLSSYLKKILKYINGIVYTLLVLIEFVIILKLLLLLLLLLFI